MSIKHKMNRKSRSTTIPHYTTVPLKKDEVMPQAGDGTWFKADSNPNILVTKDGKLFRQVGRTESGRVTPQCHLKPVYYKNLNGYTIGSGTHQSLACIMANTFMPIDEFNYNAELVRFKDGDNKNFQLDNLYYIHMNEYKALDKEENRYLQLGSESNAIFFRINPKALYEVFDKPVTGEYLLTQDFKYLDEVAAQTVESTLKMSNSIARVFHPHIQHSWNTDLECPFRLALTSDKNAQEKFDRLYAKMMKELNHGDLELKRKIIGDVELEPTHLRQSKARVVGHLIKMGYNRSTARLAINEFLKIFGDGYMNLSPKEVAEIIDDLTVHDKLPPQATDEQIEKLPDDARRTHGSS